jgi:hypothetical protein
LVQQCSLVSERIFKNKEEAKLSADDSGDNPQHPFHLEGGIPIFNTRLDQLEREQAEAKTRDAEYKDEQLRIDRKMVLFTFLLVVCTAFVGGINYYQAHVANNGVQAAKKSADAAEKAATTAASALDENRQQFRDTLTQIKEQTTAQQTAANASIAAAKTARDSLNVSQRAYITIGRKDGVVGGFIGSKNPTQNAELVMFFQNSGHVPARLSWGTSVGFVAGNPPVPTGIVYDHPFRPMGRTREKKTGGGISDTVESVIVPSDSIFMAEIGRISQKDLDDFQSKNTYPAIFGMYQYCDGLGANSIHTFMLSYQNAPVAELSFKLNEDREFVAVRPHSDAKVEYLSPCEDLVPPKK